MLICLSPLPEAHVTRKCVSSDVFTAQREYVKSFI